MPRTVDVELWDDLCGSCGVGDVVIVTGVVKVLATGDDLGELVVGGMAWICRQDGRVRN